MKEVERWYDESYDEWDRLENHIVEFDITKRYLDKYIIGDSLEIFDIGGGPGRYAIRLAKKGHQVSLLYLSSRNIEVAKEKAAQERIELKGYIHGNALDLSDHKNVYDVILLMGPLYHLVKLEDRVTCIQNALNLLKPGGILIASFISSYAPLQDYLKGLYPLNCVEDVLSYLSEGSNDGDSGFTTAYFSDPFEAQELMAQFNLKQLDFVGVENILSGKEENLKKLTSEQYGKYLDVAYELSKDPNLYGMSEHFLYIGQKQ